MIDKLVVGPLGVNTYFVIDKETNSGFVIDPGAQAQDILDKIKKNNWDISMILLTHGHYDHIGAAQALKEALGCPIIAHKEGRVYLEDSARNLSTAFGSEAVELKADHYITEDDRESKELGAALPAALGFKVLYAPGHTTDSIIFYFEHYKAAFVGDVIFRESIGRTDLQDGDGPGLLEAIKTQVFTLPEETALYPGHGPSTTVGYEKQHNPYFNRSF